MEHPSIEELIALARSDDRALGALLERHRAFLLTLARRDLRSSLAVRVDASDVVQQSFLEAQQDFPHFRGGEAASVLVWLRRILQRNIHDAVRRHHVAERRAVRREDALDRSSAAALRANLKAPQSSPSRRAIRNQEREHLERALSRLPEDQAIAVRLRHIEGRSLEEIATALARTPAAAASLIKRGMKSLRSLLQGEENA